MSQLLQTLATSALALCCGGATLSFPSFDEQDPRDLAPHVKISLREALVRAVALQPGRAFEAELELWTEGEQHGLAYEIDVLGQHGELFEVSIDAQTGGTRSTEREEDEEEARAARVVLRHCELDLAALIAKGEGIVKGTAVSAALAFSDGPLCEIHFANGRHLLALELEGRAGHLLGIALIPEEGHEGDEDEDGEDEDGDDDDGEEDGEDDDEDRENGGGEEARGGVIHVRHPAPLWRRFGLHIGKF